MHLQLKVKSDAYRYLWLKHVSGFDPDVHCARCLRGSYARLLPYGKIAAGMEVASELDEEAAPVHYLCGVTPRWAENLHIAFVARSGSVIRYEDAHIAVVIEDAEQVPILPLPDEIARTLTKPFWSCRNYQFGWHFFPTPGKSGTETSR